MFKKRAAIKIKHLKIATILDTFSYQVFEPEAKLLQLTPQQWQEELNTFQPDILLVESAWRGKDDLWDQKVVYSTDELSELVKYCKENSIPTVFWNKEDPYHFDDFIKTAKLFEFVFTTDIECMPLYEKHLDHKNIFLLPFACQPRIHNPIEKYDRKNAFVFAGAFYNRFSKRNAQFAAMVNVLASEGEVEIYDRNYGNEKTVFKFPNEYHRFIRGGLTYNKIDIAYKGYKYAINLNSMTESPTMFSRRIFELMASNTIVLSNYAVGSQMLLGDLIVSTDSAEELKEKVRFMDQEPLFEKKIRLAALRKVMLEHTAQDRLNEIVSKVFSYNPKVDLPHITCISYVKKQREIQPIRKVFLAQSYQNKSLLLVCADGVDHDFEEDENMTCIKEIDYQNIRNDFGDTDYLAGLSIDDYYGKNYLTDLILATRYCDAHIITKGGCYVYDEEKGLELETNDTKLYTSSTFAAVRSSILEKSMMGHRSIVDFAKAIDMEHYISESIFAIDEFNYCKNGSTGRLGIREKTEVDDLYELDRGVSIDDKWINKQLAIIRHQQVCAEQRLATQFEKQNNEATATIKAKTAQLAQLKTELNALSTIRFLHHPIKKISTFNKLMAVYQKLE